MSFTNKNNLLYLVAQEKMELKQIFCEKSDTASLEQKRLYFETYFCLPTEI